MKKQETLEEVIFKKYPRSISEEDSELRNAFIEVAKWQQERMYSEEEVIAILENFSSTFDLITITPKQWFEQFKNK